MPATRATSASRCPRGSLGDERYLLDYRFVFYDDRGMEVEPVMGWRMFSLEPREQRRVEAQALDARARDWRLQIKWANR
ncbi:MAG: YcfL family protein [Phycisphaerales bacterium]